ncbi:3-hexulose-6-phosphate synthase [Amedibacillus sp. YH-ame6]
MKLQIALDEVSVEEGMKLCEELRNYIDIIEIGTPFVIREGTKAVELFAKAFPEKEILADLKIMDAGDYESQLAFDANAEYATVLAVTDLLTIKGCVDAANRYNKQCVVDLICEQDFPSKIKALEEIGVHVIAVHTGADQQHAGRTPLEDLTEVKSLVKNAKVAVAGGINSSTIEKYVTLKPDIIIVGSGICNHANPLEEAKRIKEKMC